ncbi:MULTISPECIES: dihydrofolate reductase family protein [unclassified Pseudoclavibacter]|uniref:dihydrofolate reductase family protein n=1 Tax=unclassified Pseudoclavibacter TaxID=2615177 RepID=UPI001BA9A03D|nr:dihydrofolate reductase family protein [Pseudoclavibacter sp. Marseille-Q4354]MBS3178162.1 dihydrofolate reductase family protein [Pseudoclavibacter sp. Marseille-Q4354]
MRKVTYSLALTLDGYIKDEDGSFDWGDPSEEVFRLATDEVRGVDVHLMGRRLYETMVYWEPTDEERDYGQLEEEFAELWRALPKIVFSNTITEVRGKTRIAGGTLAEEIAQLKNEPGDGAIAIGGAELAHQVADLDLIDEYLLRICPVLVGGGTPFFSRNNRRTALELLDSRTFESGVVHLRYRVIR